RQLGHGVDVGRRPDAHPAYELRGRVGKDVPEQVAGDDDLELGRVAHQLHRGRVDIQVARLEVRVFLGDRLPALLPQRAGVGHGVGLVDHHDFTLSDLKGVLDDASHAEVGVEVLLD